MRAVVLKLDRSQVLDYSHAGRAARAKVRKAVRRILNLGRREARQRISAEFQVQTGFLRRQARRMQTKVTVSQSEIKGRVAPLPRLMNIFEHGATLAQGRGILRPRPVVMPAHDAMQAGAEKELSAILQEIGR